MRPLVFEERGCDLLEITLNYGIRGAPSDWSVLPKLCSPSDWSVLPNFVSPPTLISLHHQVCYMPAIVRSKELGTCRERGHVWTCDVRGSVLANEWLAGYLPCSTVQYKGAVVVSVTTWRRGS